MMRGFNSEATAALAKQIDIPVFASGGVNSYDDVDRLCRIAVHGVAGAIVGRAMYDGTIELEVAQQRADSALSGLAS